MLADNLSPTFQGYNGVTQGNPLYSTVFNVVVETVIRYWVTVVAPTEAGAEVIEENIQDLEALFYAGDGLVALPCPERLQRTFKILTDLFYRAGLRKNVWKMVSTA